MKALTRTALCLALLANAQSAWSYSVKDDLAAANAYKSAPGHKEAAAQFYLQSVQELTKGHYRKAHDLLEAALRVEGGCADIYSTYGYCQTGLDNNQEGAQALAKAIMLGPAKSIYYYRKALCYFSTMQFKEAITELNWILNKEPNNADCLRLRARCQRTLHNDAAAIADFSQLIKMNAYAAEAYTERGNIYAGMGDKTRALQDFNAAIKLAPSTGEAYVGRGTVYYQMKNYRAALDNYTAANVYGNDKTNFCRLQSQLCKDCLRTAQK
ncbi:MAG: tetratricopeptide repeat protein [Cyanobacteria bacterium SZAS LIN-3]|nr:tetratricopeptide repeat protein [Cyanobacteria bacterium SZAS LIN-3]